MSKKKEGSLESLSSVTRGASFHFVGKILNDAIGFLLNLALTRGLGVGLYGVYAFANTVIKISMVFTNLGSDKSLLRFLPQYEGKSLKQRYFLTLAVITSLSGGLIVAGSLFIFSPFISRVSLNQPELVTVLKMFGLLLVFDTLAKVFYTVFRSYECLEYEVLSNKIVRPIIRLCAVVLALEVGYSLIGVTAALVVASAFSLGFVLYIYISKIGLLPAFRLEDRQRQYTYNYYNFSLPVTFKNVGDMLIKRVDVLMVGFFLPSASVGIYNISILLGSFITLPLSAFNQLFPPIASKLFSNGNMEELDSLCKTITRWIFTVSWLMVIGSLLYRHELLAIFGEDFTGGTTVFVIFAISQLFNCIGGPNGYLLMMTEHQYALMLTQWIFGIINVILNYVLIMEFGLIGAAMATAGILALLNITHTMILWQLEGIFPYSISFVKPLIAGTITVVPLLILKYYFEGIVLIVVGACVGVISYTILIATFGIEEKDKEFFQLIVLKKIRS